MHAENSQWKRIKRLVHRRENKLIMFKILPHFAYIRPPFWIEVTTQSNHLKWNTQSVPFGFLLKVRFS